ncbi:MAG: hypothetical protein IT307_04870 [Chloroflexi bacterium]|nr:hypothetical protein [Chloroflexota bacterium]
MIVAGAAGPFLEVLFENGGIRRTDVEVFNARLAKMPTVLKTGGRARRERHTMLASLGHGHRA